MGRFDQRLLNPVSLVVGAFALAVVLAMSSEVQAKRWPYQHHPDEPFHLISDDHTDRSEKHDEMHDDRHGRSNKLHQLSIDHAALSAKLDEVLLAISALPVSSDHTALSAELDEVRDAITALPAGTALSAKLDEVLLAITPIPAGPSLSEKLDEVLVEITALPAGADLSVKLDEVLLAISALPAGADLSVKLDEVLLAITPTPAGPSLSEKLDAVLVAIDATPSGGAPPCGAGTEGVRFVVSTDGTEVCDNTTGLVWEQTPDSIKREWQAAIAFCPTIGYRLPEVKELFSLVDFSQSNPTLPAGHPFSNVQSSIYWSATPRPDFPLDACSVVFRDGTISASFKTNAHFVWCVRDGP